MCKTHVLPQLPQFWNLFRADLANKESYKANIGNIRLKLQELQEINPELQELRSKDGYQEVDGVLHHESLPCVPEAIWIEMISRYYDNLPASHFDIKKTHKLLAQKYFWPIFRHNVKAYVKGCDICLASKAIWHKLYIDLQSLPVPTYWWKDLLMDFMTGLPISTNWKRDNYHSILVIVDWLRKMVQYKPIKITINAPWLAKVIIDVIIWQHGLPNWIVTDRYSFFISKFWSLLCYFLGIKRRLSTAFHLQTDGQTIHQNSTIKAYLRFFVNFKQNDWIRLLPMAEFTYNNAKNASTGHMSFELNCGYHFCVSFKKDTVLALSQKQLTSY